MTGSAIDLVLLIACWLLIGWLLQKESRNQRNQGEGQ